MGFSAYKMGRSLLLACMFMSSAIASTFVRPNGDAFDLCGQPFRFVGFNVRGICHYGYGDALPFSSTSDIATNLDYCTAANVRIIRSFCAYKNIGQTETGDRLQVVLDACQTRGIKVLVVLTDMYGDTQMHPQGDSGYYTVPGWGFTMLNHAFFESGYRNNYLPQALYLADRFQHHPAVFAWQIGNELRDTTSGATFVAFCRDVAAQIRAVDPNHMISAGVISRTEALVTVAESLQLFGAMDFVNSHIYHGNDAYDDSWLANELDMPYVVDEAGFSEGDRIASSDADMNKRFNVSGADGYLQWALMATPYDNGDGDRIVGVDQVFHGNDFVEYGALFHNWGASFMLLPEFIVGPEYVTHTIHMGQALPNDSFLLSIGGSGTHTFTIRELMPWMSISPTRGMVSCGEDASLEVQYAVSSLRPSQYGGWFQITSETVSNSPFVAVLITVLAPPGDMDGDNDVDQADFGMFQVCYSGSGITQDDPACHGALLDNDFDVDLDDFGLFQRCITGPNIPANLSCLSH